MAKLRVSCKSWILWSVNLAVALVYSVIALVTFSNLAYMDDHTEFSGGSINFSAMISGMMASCFLGFASVAGFAIASGIVLLTNLFGQTYMGYGFLLGASCNTAFVVLLAGIVLNTFSSLMDEVVGLSWSSTDQGVYVTTWVFSYVMTGLFFCTFLGLIFARRFFIGEVEPSGLAPDSGVVGAPKPVKEKKEKKSKKTGDIEATSGAPQPMWDNPTPPPAGQDGAGASGGAAYAGGGFGRGWGGL